MDNWIGHGGTFAVYGIFAFCGFLFIYKYVPETKGLSEKEKKKLFLPGSKYGRKLDENETRGPPSESTESGMVSLDKISEKRRKEQDNALNAQIDSDRKNLLQINESLISSAESLDKSLGREKYWAQLILREIDIVVKNFDFSKITNP